MELAHRFQFAQQQNIITACQVSRRTRHEYGSTPNQQLERTRKALSVFWYDLRGPLNTVLGIR